MVAKERGKEGKYIYIERQYFAHNNEEYMVNLENVQRGTQYQTCWEFLV